MANEKRLIDAKAFRKELCDERNYPGRSEEFMIAIDVAIADLVDAPTVDAVPAEKYNALKEQYERMKEIADILDTALRQYQRQYGE